MRYHGTRQTARANLGRWVYTQVDRLLNHAMTERLVYVSSLVREECVTSRLSPPGKSVTIPNGIELSHFPGRSGRDASRQKLRLAEKDTVITYTGRLDLQKNLDMLLEAFFPLHREHKSVQLWLVGDGTGRGELEQRVRSLGMEDQVHFWGYQEDVYPYLTASDIFVLPSSNEAMPVSLLEALACGLPCVAARVGEIQRMIEHGKQGLLIPPLDSAALTQAFLQLIHSSGLLQPMSRSALELAPGFSAELAVKQVNAVYAELLNHHKRPSA